jgi:hypothetical protein
MTVMDKQDLIRAILRVADQERSDASSEKIVTPLRAFGTVWFAEGHWMFTEQVAEIGTYTANGGSISRFGEGQFDVKQLTKEDYERAKQSWDTYGSRL